MKLHRSSDRPHWLKKALITGLALSLSAPAPFTALAATHPLTAVADANTIDYVVNVDWDYDSPPTQATNPNQVLDRAYITSVIRVLAQSIFTMTEGRHKLGNVFVYRNKTFSTNVDIQLINTNDRSSANVAGWAVRNSSSFNHLAFENTAESIDAMGKVIAHELGHYTYGLFDEYVEAGKALDLNDPGSPSGVDNAKTTIMNNHLASPSLSTPADYADSSQRQTAQSRMMATGTALSGGSAWETLVRTTDQDPVAARSLGRTFFEAFRGINPATLQLTRPVAGFDSKLNIVFAPSPVFRDVIVVDRTLPAARLAELVQSAKALVSQAGANTEYAIVTSPASGTGPLLNYTRSSIEGKQALSAALDSIQPVASGSFDSLAAFTQGFQLLANARKAGDTSTFHMLTGNETAVPAEAATTARIARVSVNALGLTGATPEQRQGVREKARTQSASGTSISLAQLAQQTGGSFNSAKTGTEGAKNIIRGEKEAHAAAFAVLSFDASTALSTGGRFDSEFRVASQTTDGDVEVELTFDPADASKLSFSLVAPDGTVHASSALPDGITFTNNATEGLVSFAIGSGFAARTGSWKARVNASAIMTEGIGLAVSTNTLLALSADVEGGAVGSASGPVLKASLGAEKRIKGASVTAAIYDADGNLVLDNLVLRDDGISPDLRGGDGEYVADLSGKLAPGEYYALLVGQTSDSSRIASLGALIKGARNEESPVELLTRMAEVGFALESGATGVTAAASPTPSTSVTTPSVSLTDSGGCTVNANGRDAGLVLLLASAMTGLFLRRRARRQRVD